MSRLAQEDKQPAQNATGNSSRALSPFSYGDLTLLHDAEEARAHLAQTGTCVMLADHRAYSPPDRRGSGARRDAARLILGDLMGCPPEAVTLLSDENGAPMIEKRGKPYFISFAGRAGWSLIGISTHPIGVDLEKRLPAAELPLNILRADERAILAEAEPDDASSLFLRLWTIKEALSKALRKGLFLAPEEIKLELDSFPTISTADKDGDWQKIEINRISYREISPEAGPNMENSFQFGLASVTLGS